MPSHVPGTVDRATTIVPAETTARAPAVTIAPSTLAERLLRAALAAVVPAFGVAWLLHVMAPVLAQRPTFLVWSLVGLWVSGTIAGAFVRGVRLWVAALWASAALALLAALHGLAGRTTFHWEVGLAMASFATACAWGAVRLERAAARSLDAKKAPAHGAGTRTYAPIAVALALGWRYGPGVLVWVESFRWAHLIARDPARGAGMLGMLIAFFLMLPAASLRTRLPSAAAVLDALATAALLATAAMLPEGVLRIATIAAALLAACGGVDSMVRAMHARAGAASGRARYR